MRTQARWTILLYMNADTKDLDDDAVVSFRNLATVGSTPDVNVVVQFDRPDLRSTANTEPGRWSYALRFHVTQSMPPHRDYALPGFGNEVNMGDGRSLAEFVEWGTRAFPSQHVMLIMWGHGQGYAVSSKPLFRRLLTELCTAPWSDEVTSLVRSRPTRFQTALVDAVTNDPLYVREMQLSLEGVLHGKPKLDVIAFDSCLMAMVEVAHAVRNIADFMVASEDIEPASGWSYGWLKQLVERPETTPEELARLIVTSIEDETSFPPDEGCSAFHVETVSALNLSRIDPVTAAIDALVDALIAGGDRARSAMLRARNTCQAFGVTSGAVYVHSIDLRFLLERLLTETDDADIVAAADHLRDVVVDLVVGEYAVGSKAVAPYSASGLAIYFPPKDKLMFADPYVGCYLGNDPHCPVIEFASLHRWKNFLLWLFGRESEPRLPAISLTTLRVRLEAEIAASASLSSGERGLS